jgi:lipopolysaccharide export system protein LptA
MSAQRASAPARLAAVLSAVVLVAVAAAVAVRLAGRREAPVPPAAAPPPEGRVVDLKERVRHEEYVGGRLVAEIRGDTFALGPDGRNHLAGSVDVTYYGRDGAAASRLTAGEIVYAPGTLRFMIQGGVRVEAGDVVLEGDSFEYDKSAGLFETAKGGRFVSRALSGSAPEISYAEAADEVRLGGGFRVEIAEAAGTGRAAALSGGSFVFDRRGLRGRVDGQAALQGAGFRGSSAAATFVASEDGSRLESAVFERGAEIVFGGAGPPGDGGGEIRADRIAVSFVRDPFGLGALRTSGGSRLSLRSAADRTETVSAPAALLSFDRARGLWTWSASGGIRVETTEGGLSRALEGEEAVFDGAGSLGVNGGPGRPAVADSADARIGAAKILVASAAGDILATGGVSGVLKAGEGRRPVGFFSRQEDISVSCRSLDLRPGTSISSFTGNVILRQGADLLQAGEIEIAGDMGRMSGGGGVAVALTEAAAGRAQARTVEIGGRDMVYRPDTRTLTLSSKAFIRLPEASLEADSVSAVIGREGQGAGSFAAAGGVTVTKGNYVARAEAATYEAEADRITLTGKPVLTDGKGGSARGAKLTFDLADDKILVENEGPGRSTTVVKS